MLNTLQASANKLEKRRKHVGPRSHVEFARSGDYLMRVGIEVRVYMQLA